MGHFVKTAQFDFVAVTSVTVEPGGSVAIHFNDPNFVRAELIRVNVQSGCLEAILHEGAHEVGQVPKNLTDALARQSKVCLSAIRPDGSLLEMNAGVVVH